MPTRDTPDDAVFRVLIEESMEGILVHRAMKPLFVNESWARIHGYSVAEVLRLETVLPLLHAEEHDRMLDYTHSRLSGLEVPTHYEYRGLHRDGSTLWLGNMVRRIDWLGEPAVLVTSIDITERKQRDQELATMNLELEARVARRTLELKASNEQLEIEIAERKRVAAELSHSQALYESLVETIPLCVARKSLDGKFVFANRALRDLFGKTLEELVGHDDFDFSPTGLAEQYRLDDQRVIDSGEQLEFVETTEFGSEMRHIHTLKTPIRDPSGTITGTQLIFWDITEQVVSDHAREKAQQELEFSNRDLRTLLFVISHDLKEPVRAIQSFAMLVSERSAESLDDRSRDFLARVIDASNRMHQLLDDVLMLSRAQRTVDPSSRIELELVVRDVLIQLSARIEQTNAKIEVVSPLPIVQGDRRWLTQALQNLVANALKFTNDGAAPEIQILAFRDDGVAGIVVEDRGIGVDVEHAERIFELFQRAVSRKIEGTGAGLAIVRQVAERHGGRAYVLPRDGGGSRFVMSFADEFVA